MNFHLKNVFIGFFDKNKKGFLVYKIIIFIKFVVMILIRFLLSLLLVLYCRNLNSDHFGRDMLKQLRLSFEVLEDH